MKIVLWIGNAENQKVLASRIHSIYKVDAIFLEQKRKSKNSFFNLAFSKILAQFFFPSITRSWKHLMNFYKEKNSSLTGIQIFEVSTINDEETYNRTLQIAPDLIIVSGTKIIKDKLLSLHPKIGILNLHTGLSPYMKGGPNCTNWCIAKGHFHLIGSTIMWLNAGVDSGDIVVSKRTEFTGDESLEDIHVKVMEDAHALYLYAIEKLVNGFTSRVPQSLISPGKTYYTKDWDLKQKLLLMKNFRNFKEVIHSEDYQIKKLSVKTVDFKPAN